MAAPSVSRETRGALGPDESVLEARPRARTRSQGACQRPVPALACSRKTSIVRFPEPVVHPVHAPGPSGPRLLESAILAGRDRAPATIMPPECGANPAAGATHWKRQQEAIPMFNHPERFASWPSSEASRSWQRWRFPASPKPAPRPCSSASRAAVPRATTRAVSRPPRGPADSSPSTRRQQPGAPTTRMALRLLRPRPGQGNHRACECQLGRRTVERRLLGPRHQRRWAVCGVLRSRHQLDVR